MNTLKLKIRRDNNRNTLFFDFLIDGKSLYDLCEIEKWDRIGPLGWGVNAAYETGLVKQFLGMEKNTELESGRISVFVCAECGDIGCGATTVEIIETEHEVVWSDFGDENNYEPEVNLVSYRGIGPFRFDKSQYLHAFDEVLNAISAWDQG